MNKTGERIKTQLKEKGISRQQLKKTTGLKDWQLSRIMNNKGSLTLKNIIKIADALYCSVDLLLGRK